MSYGHGSPGDSPALTSWLAQQQQGYRFKHELSSWDAEQHETTCRSSAGQSDPQLQEPHRAPQSQGDEQKAATVLLGGARRTPCTVPPPDPGCTCALQVLIPAQGWGSGCLLPSHQTKRSFHEEEASSTPGLSPSGLNKMGGTSASPVGQDPMLVGHTDGWG